MTGILNLKYHTSDNGFCRSYYKSEKGLLYCLQNEGERFGGILLYRCSMDGEPDYPVGFANIKTIELPKGSDTIDKEVAAFLKAKGLANNKPDFTAQHAVMKAKPRSGIKPMQP